jgi:1,4-alpha-glucan branching enzyme
MSNHDSRSDDQLKHGLDALLRAEHGDPFALLGPQIDEQGVVIRTFQPGALQVELIAAETGESLGLLDQAGHSGLFSLRLPGLVDYRYRISWPGALQETEDPYAFASQLGELDIYLFSEGKHRDLAKSFGAQLIEVDGVQGVRFSVWAPNARRVSVVGQFNSWDGRRHPMRLHPTAGVWELFIPRLKFSVAMAFCRYVPILSRWPQSCRRRPARWWLKSWISTGTMAPGCSNVPLHLRSPVRCPSMSCTRDHGAMVRASKRVKRLRY